MAHWKNFLKGQACVKIGPFVYHISSLPNEILAVTISLVSPYILFCVDISVYYSVTVHILFCIPTLYP